MLFLGCQALRGKPQRVAGYIHCISGFLTSPHFLHLTSLLFPDKLFLIFTIHFKPTIPSCLLLILAGTVTPNFTERNKATWTPFSLKFRTCFPTCLLHWESFDQYFQKPDSACWFLIFLLEDSGKAEETRRAEEKTFRGCCSAEWKKRRWVRWWKITGDVLVFKGSASGRLALSAYLLWL